MASWMYASIFCEVPKVARPTPVCIVVVLEWLEKSSVLYMAVDIIALYVTERGEEWY